jgi:hypothetical protein
VLIKAGAQVPKKKWKQILDNNDVKTSIYMLMCSSKAGAQVPKKKRE